MAASLEGKVALVTGGSSGIGRATSLAFARAGAKVVISDVDGKGGDETARKVKEAGGEAIFVKADVSKTADVKALIDKAVQTYGRLDCAYNNAGIEGPVASIHEYPEDSWNRVIDVNLKGVWLCMMYEIPQMLQQGSGAIVNTSSISGLKGSQRWSAYVASKHGVIGLTRAAAVEYGKAGIRVNAVCPGAVDTPMGQRVLALNLEMDPPYIEEYPLDRVGSPEEIAEPVVWLCSDEASYITGVVLSIDGGWAAQ